MSNNQNNHPADNNRKKEKEIDDNKREKIMILHGLLPRSTMLINGYNRSPCFEKPAIPRSDLIPRVMNTNVMVYMMTTDVQIHLDANAAAHTAGQSSNFSQPPDALNIERKNSVLSEVPNIIETSDDQGDAADAGDLLRSLFKSDHDLSCSTFDVDGHEFTPLSYAAWKGKFNIVAYILDKCEDSMNYPNKLGSYPIHMACLKGNLEILNKFYSKSPNSLVVFDSHEHRRGQTVLHIAAANKSETVAKELVSFLLEKKEGRDLINKKDQNGHTPWDLADANGNDEVKNMITAAGESADKSSTASTARGSAGKSSTTSEAGGSAGKSSTTSEAGGSAGKSSTSSEAGGSAGKGKSIASAAGGSAGKSSTASTAGRSAGKSSTSSEAGGSAGKGKSSTTSAAGGSAGKSSTASAAGGSAGKGKSSTVSAAGGSADKGKSSTASAAGGSVGKSSTSSCQRK